MDFQKTFKALTGYLPLCWQQRLYTQICSGQLPDVCDLPTGLGKTSVIAIWLIALAKQIDAGTILLPRRLIYIVNRRTVVDQATIIVEELRKRINEASEPELKWLKETLHKVRANKNQDEPVLAVSTLRGELADNEEWKSDPARPAIIVGTIDMIGSKLLFTGYGDSCKLRPHHAGLIGQDALIVHDEAHLTPAFSDLLQTVVKEQNRFKEARSVVFLELSATASNIAGRRVFDLKPEDELDDLVHQRLNAQKSLYLHEIQSDDAAKTAETTIVQQTHKYDAEACKVLIYVSSPETAHRIVALLKKQVGKGAEERIALLTGTIRGHERDRMVKENPVYQAFLDSGLRVKHTVYLVSTSAGEVGIDLDADHMVCDLTTLDAMIQRLGRVNRRGGEGRHARVDVITADTHTRKKEDDKERDLTPIDQARLNTLTAIKNLPQKADGCYDASPMALRQLLVKFPSAVAPKPETVPLTDVLLDSWTLTTLKGKLPGQPEVATYLHGLEANQPETYVTWRAEVSLLAEANISSEQLQDWFRHCRIEARERLRDATYRVLKELQKIAERHNGGDLPVVVLSERGEPERSYLKDVLRAGVPAIAYRTVILPVEAGGLTDEGLLDGKTEKQAVDVAEASGQRERLLLEGGNGPYSVRALINYPAKNSLSGEADSTIDQPSPQKAAAQVARRYRRSMSQLVPLRLPSEWEREEEVEQRFLLLLVEPKRAAEETPESANTEKQPTVKEHCELAERWAAQFAKVLNLEDGQKQALMIAARWHDRGKARKVWQRAIFNDDDTTAYAKSGPQGMDSRRLNGYRHEFGSLLEAMADSEISSHPEADLILHLIAVHHGWARPNFLPSAWDLERHTEAQNRKAALEAMRRFGRLQQRFGRWGLAWLECLMHCVDILASHQIAAPDEVRPNARLTGDRPMLQSKFAIKVDTTNPGQFFACCGLFELAHRLWPGVEGYFDTQAGMFIFPCKSQQDGIELLKKLSECPLEGLSDAERQELKSLEACKQELKKQKEKLDPQKEKRRKALGDKSRSGRLMMGEPFSLLLDWWQTEDETTPKTWAGKQEIHKVARAAQEALKAVINNLEDILDHVCVLHQTWEYAKKSDEKKSDENKKVAPFYFDARSFIHSLDTGFSTDVQEMELVAYPAVELLALIGLQRFRPAAQGQDFDYWMWTYPMPAPVAAAIVCGAASAEAGIRYRFRFRFRDDQRRYKAFGYSTLVKGE